MKSSRAARPVAAIGIFDGVHRGHRVILRKAVARAKKIHGTPMAVTFYPHPLAVLAPKLVPPLILSLDQRLKAFASCGIRVSVVLPFTKRLSLLAPQDFVKRVLVDRFHAREVVVGHDFGFGHKRSGTTKTLRALGRRFGFRVHVVPAVKVGGKRVSSRLIREAIGRGELTQARRYLGGEISVVGTVVRGSKRGRGLGFPTANVAVSAGVLPAVGVYAVWVRMSRSRYTGMANIGFRPTFERKKRHTPLLEVHLLDLKKSLYGKELEVIFIQRLRAERRFSSPQALAAQLKIDACQAQRIL